MAAYSEIVKQARIAAANPKPKNKLKKSGETSETTTPIASNESNNPKVPSLYKTVSAVFENTSVYLINSAINEAKGIKKSQDELLKLEIQTLKTQIQKVENKIARILQQKTELQFIKDNLKAGNPPFKRGTRKYKLNDGKVTVSVGVGKNKKVFEYDTVYLFEPEYLRPRQKQMRQRIGALTFKLNKLNTKLNKINSPTYVPQVVFGGKRLQKQANRSKDKLRQYKHQRVKQFTVSGRNDSRVGNFVFEYDYINNAMRIKINGQTFIIPNVHYPYGSDWIKAYYENQLSNYKTKGSARKPITYTITDYGKYYIINCTLDVESEINIFGKTNGVIGIDTNLGFWSITNISPDGNLIFTTDINYDWRNKSSGQILANIRDAAKSAVDIALVTGKPIVIEDLDIKANKKVKDYNDSRNKNFSRNMFAYHKMTEALTSRANKCGVQIYVVEPQYTSLIGRVKFMSHYKLPVHNLAAFTIGRRFLQYNERIPKSINKRTWAQVYTHVNKQVKAA